MQEKQYNSIYSEHSNYFGDKPDEMLENHCRLINRSKPVLDIGAGQGRNSLFLAGQGFNVDAIDTSYVAVEHLASRARKQNLLINPCNVSFEDLRVEDGYYSAILLFGIIQLLRWEDISFLIHKIHKWLTDDGLVFVLAFRKDDPSYERFSKEKQIGTNSFITTSGGVRTFLEPNEILKLFDGFDAVYHWEGLGPVHKHVDNPPEQHAEVHAVLRKH
ncbi:MAG: class I SAM-dependent methyltransferase [candidate division Zixibacteria bacterium]|nr:class I SAM-dependent methyltransferase [candidate division Zixibacteria bacterium]MBU1469462.1 class I SAM-dependent methyltransferase [candidate division Zixibacteria bacterium]MBU2624216.1 class I SAM-dependent methyltransferase [candidate division Zixibacteria bacterium]